MAPSRGSSRNKKTKPVKKKSVAYKSICRYGVLLGCETVSPGKCKMSLSLVTFNTTQDKKEKKRACTSHKKVDITASAILPTSRFPKPRKQLSELGRAEAALRFRQDG